jgi:hypothetical protein
LYELAFVTPEKLPSLVDVGGGLEPNIVVDNAPSHHDPND